MALTPISLFQSQGNGIAQFLQGGQNALASALNNVIQVGRDTANKQFAQERDFLSEQKRVEDLAQRRGENVQQQSNFDRTFARNLFTTDREFADRNADQERAEKRLDAQDLFRQTEADRNFDLRKSEAESLQESRDLSIKEAERVAAGRADEARFYRDINAQPSEPNRMSAEFLLGPVSATATTGTPEERLAEATIRMQAAEKINDTENFTKYAKEKAVLEAEVQPRGGLTPAEYRAQIKFGQGQQDRITKEQEAQTTKAAEATEQERKLANAQIEMLLSDYKAFPPAQSFIPKEGLSEEEKIAAEAEAKATDSNRALVEVQAALDSETFDDYLIKSVSAAEKRGESWVNLTRDEKLTKAKALGPEVIKKRKKLYTLARKTGLAGEAAPAAPAAGKSSVDAYVDTVVTGAKEIGD